ncbi:MAG: DUF885 domain-containing protein [Chloroflexota bacterium]
MRQKNSARSSMALAIALLLLACNYISPTYAPTALATTGGAVPGDGSRTFAETGKTVHGVFLDYWQQHGGLAQQGFPISEEMQETSDLNGKSYTVQYFERAVFEHHSENAAPNDVLLSQLGTFRYKQKYPGGAPGQKASTAPNTTNFTQVNKRVGGKFLDYWNKNGGLAQQGYPISEEFQEKSDLDGKTYTVQYFERAVFELHPDNQTPYDVLLSQLGTFRYGAKYSTQIAAGTPLNDFYEEVFLNLLLRDPEAFTSVGLPEEYKPGFRPDKLTNVSDPYLRDTNALVKQYLAQLRTYDRKVQKPQQLISTSIVDWHLDDLVKGQEFMYHDYIVNPITGVQNSVVDLLNNLQPLANKQDAEDYIARLNDVGNKFDGVLEQLRIREEKSIFMPRWMIDATIGQLRHFVSQDARSNELYANFKLRVDALGGINAADKQALYSAAQNALTSTVYPAYNRIIDYMTRLTPKGRATDGVWALPNGDAYYRYAIHHQTSTDMTPEEIHNLGLSEVTRIRAEMRTILDGMGYKNSSFIDAMDKMRDASGVYPLNTQADKDKLLDVFRTTIDRADKGISSQFDIKPKIGLEVRAVPQDKEAGSPGGFYFAPALDGSRPGIFYANLGRGSYPKYQIPTLAYHEAIPGHHFQLGIQTELKNVPTFQKSGIFPPANAYVEGWALYAEQLMYDAGFYKDDPAGNLGRLQAELFRSARLVVDTGIHWKHWTREQAISYMDDTLGTRGGAYTGEVERYIAWPAQALAYKTGSLKILALRDRAQKALGAKFNIKEFHNAVLQNGSMPLSTLETIIDNYIASKK